MTTTKSPALIYRFGNGWRCETPGIGHHAGGDTAIFRTAKAATEYAKKKGYRVKRCPDCDADGAEYQFDDSAFRA